MMKRYPILALFLSFIFLLGFVHGITYYLLPGEKLSNFSSQRIVVENQTYFLYSYKSNGSPVLLIRNGKAVEDPQEIMEIMKKYYEENYMISPQNISQIRELLLIINESRNNGDKFPGKEEDMCRRVLGERYNLPKNWRKIYHDDLYYFYSAATCSYFQGFIPCQKPEDIYDDIKEFFEASNENNELIADALEKADTITSSNVYDVLKSIKDNLEDIEDNAEKLESSIFRFPIHGSSECNNCFGICPPVLYNHTAMDELSSLLSHLITQTKPLGELPSKIAALTKETQRRVEYRKNLAIYEKYKEDIEEAEKLWNDTFPIINESVAKVKDANKTKAFNNLLSLHNLFEEKLQKFNMSDINITLANLTSLIHELYNQSLSDLEAYKEVEMLSKEIDAYAFLVEQEGETLGNITEEKEVLDVGLKAGVSRSALSSYGEDYSELLSSARSTYPLRKGALSKMLRVLLAPFSRGVIALGDAIPAVSSLFYSHTAIIASLALGLLLFSLSSFLGIILYSAKSTILGIPIHKGTYRFIYFTVLLVIAGFGFFLGIASYIPMAANVIRPSVIDLFKEASHSSEVYLLLDKSQISNFNERLSCMEEVKDYLESKGIAVYIGNLSASSCSIGNQTYNCLNKGTLLIFSSSSENTVYGEDIPTIRIYIAGNKQFYEECIVPGFFGIAEG